MAINPNSNAALELSDQKDYIMNAPIAEVAAHLGMDIDEAVKMRVLAAVEAASPKMDVAVRPIEPQGNLYGFASVTIGGVKIDDFKIVENKDGELFVGMPSKPDKGSQSGFRNTVHVDKDFREAFSAAVIGEYHAAVREAQSRAANLKAAPDKPRMAEQVQSAAKEAAKHNADLPPKEKTAKHRGERE